LNSVTYIWDKNKNRLNHQKHKIWFNEAATVFDDENAIYSPDEEHSDYEERFIVIGMSRVPRLLMVCHCYKEDESVVRIISARRANKSEAELYGGGK